jgi:hypothetical protein
LTYNEYLTPLRTISVQFAEEMDYSEAGSGEYSENFLNGVLNNASYNSQVVDAWLQVAANKKTIVFATGIDHAEALAVEFRLKGVKAKAYHSKLPVMDSRDIMRDFREGKIRVLVSVNKILVGFDDPSIECGIACRPTKTRRVWQQACGRMIRLFEGKKDAILLDCAQWTAEHGFYDEPYSPPIYGEKELLRKAKEKVAVPVMKLIVGEEPTEVTRNIVIKKIEELERKRKQIPELNVKDLLAIFATSQQPLEILRVAFEMNRRKTGATYTRANVEWISETWGNMMDIYPQYHARLIKTLKTMSKNKVAQGKKLAALHYSPAWLMEQTPYVDYTMPDSVEPSSEVMANYEDDIDEECPF